MMVWLNIIGITILFLIACSVFIEICEKYNLLVSFRMRKKKEFKEWNRQRNNRTRELKKKIKDWNNQRNQRLRDWKKRQVIHKKVWAFLQKLNFLKIIYGLIALIIGLALFTLFSALLSQLLTKQFNAPNPFNLPKLKVVDSSFALAFLGTVTGIVALFGGYLAIRRSEEDKIQNKIAQKQADTAEQGLITDRINKAVEGLGKINGKNEPVLEVRIGALYALERIAQDSIRDHIRIMKIICGYIYVRKPLPNSMNKKAAVKEDVRAALMVIGQRDRWTEDQEHLKEEKNQKYKLDLRHCNLSNAELNSSDMSDAMLAEATLEESSLVNANLTDTFMQSVNFTNAYLTGTDFKNANTRYAFAYEGDFSKCPNLIQDQLDDMYCGFDVVINKKNEPKKFGRPDHWPKTKLSKDDFIKEYKVWKEAQQ